MFKIEMEKIDDMQSKLRKLRVLVFLLSFLSEELIEEDYCLEKFYLKPKSVRLFITDLIRDTLAELCDVVYAEDFYVKID